MATAFITGIGGQDSVYLAHFLLQKNYRVVGGARALPGTISSDIEYSNLKALKIFERVELLPFDLADETSIRNSLEACAPDEIYNLAAQSSVAASWENPILTGEINGLGAVRLFQTVREICPKARLFHASSSEIFGGAIETINETTPLSSRNPYGAAKIYAHQMAAHYREILGLNISCGILFNHESPLRPDSFVTRKITQSVARIKCGLQDSLSLGNLDVTRDWGFAGDFVRAMWLCLQTEADDFIVATGAPRSLRDFVEEAFRQAELDWREFVRIDESLFRPNDAAPIVADIRKSSTRLGWTPEVSFAQLVKLMLDADLQRANGTPANVRYFAD